MSLLIDTDYLNRISYQLPLFKKISNNTYNFRCPICGDSKTKKNLKRGYIFKNNKRDSLSFKCHNCTEAMSFNYFLKIINENVYKEYIFANINFHRNINKPKQEKKIKPEKSYNYQSSNKLEQLKNKVELNKYYTGLINLSKLNDDSPPKKYLIDRKIPKDQLNRFYYCEDFFGYVNKILPGKFNNDWVEDRLIIPLIDFAGRIFGIQGRSLNPTVEKKFRYITIIFDSDKAKVFGSDKIDPNKKIFIVEGPFDSVFLDNCLAACGASIDTITADVYILDNEPRNKNIIYIMNKLIKKGKSIVILDEKLYSGMDINDIIMSGKSKEFVQELINNNIYSGFAATVKLNQWKKIK